MALRALDAPRRPRGPKFQTSRPLFDDLAVVIKEFSSASGVATDARPFVLVHGIGVSSRYFHPAAAQLSRFGRVYLVDLPGYGAAPDPRRDVGIADHARVLARFLQEAGIVNPVLVGHSMGSQVVAELAVDYPGLSDRLVLMAPTMDRRARTLPRAALRLGLDMFREPLSSNFVVLSDYFVRCGIPYYLRQLPHLLNDRPEERLPLIAAKTLVLRGDHDLVCPEDWALELTALLPHGSFATVEGPHVVMFTDPGTVAERIAEHARS